jgi:hypothetical protein
MEAVHDRRRDPAEERRERDRYVVLLHVYTHALTAEGDTSMSVDRVASELVYDGAEATEIVRDLVRSGHLAADASGARVALTPDGQAYLALHAGRRKSLRYRPSPWAGGEPQTADG